MSIITTDQNYTSNLLTEELSALLSAYPFLKKETIGYSVLGKPIECIRIGTGSKEVFYSASIHANEWITCPVLMKFIEDFCISYTQNTSIKGYSARNIFQNTSIYIVPLVNPDGVDLVNRCFFYLFRTISIFKKYCKYTS